jgi:hypothetical protein
MDYSGEAKGGTVKVLALTRTRDGKTEHVGAHSRAAPPGGMVTSGSLALIFQADGGFCIHVDEEGYAMMLGGPPDLIREVTGHDPATALAQFLSASRQNETANGWPDGTIASEAERYGAFLLRD